ncbi:hypothetical protein [Hymenobacter cellulosilyticus]|uniref:Uncharacterized protein n=1 Tax=Hymenobacter cellulosilyticus TaxID=2932248 RepID=A0A8T9Q0M6_9BACT|nr:hypothetical protein [Hymenobacter cellulosilyticus]UOQ70984.1 hypothetical protein MUN79_20245 [Hymenobacter cellulosilyticus]
MRYLVLGLLTIGLPTCKIVEAGGVDGNQTTITGDGNTAATATKPGTMATGTSASATEVKKSDGVAAGEGNTVTPAAPSTWWKWLLVGMALGYLGPKLLKLGSRFVWPEPT